MPDSTRWASSRRFVPCAAMPHGAERVDDVRGQGAEVGRHDGDEQIAAARRPHLRIADRAVALRAVKLMGRLLDVEGRAVGYAQVDVWA
ncbi:hypothetical protein [Streptomyces sp. NPDC055134]